MAKQSQKARKTKYSGKNTLKQSGSTKPRKKKQSKKIKTIIVERKLSDEYMKNKEGEYFGENAY